MSWRRAWWLPLVAWLSRILPVTRRWLAHDLLGHSLRRIPSMRFDRVLLVSSVLPAKYPWSDRVRDQQVKLLRNDRAASDIPVGVLCAGLRGLGMRDIGAAGVTGSGGKTR